jgi:hypothetical protein
MRQHERKARSNTRVPDCCLPFAHGFEVETAVDNCSIAPVAEMKKRPESSIRNCSSVITYEDAVTMSRLKPRSALVVGVVLRICVNVEAGQVEKLSTLLLAPTSEHQEVR